MVAQNDGISVANPGTALSHSDPTVRSGRDHLEKRERAGKTGDLTPKQLGQQTRKAQPVSESKESPSENGHPVRQRVIGLHSEIRLPVIKFTFAYFKDLGHKGD